MRWWRVIIAAVLLCTTATASAQRRFPTRAELDSLVFPAVSKIAEGAIAVDEQLKNIGTIGSEDITRVTFTLRNTTPDRVTISEIRPACRCVRIVSAPQSLAPDSAARVVAEYQHEGLSSEFRQSVWLYTNLDTEHPTLRLEFMGVVNRE